MHLPASEALLRLLPGLRRFTQLLELVLDQKPEQGAVTVQSRMLWIVRIHALLIQKHVQTVNVRLLILGNADILAHHLLRVYDARPR